MTIIPEFHVTSFVFTESQSRPYFQHIYVVIQKCKQIANFIRQLSDSQNIVKIMINLQFFEKSKETAKIH